MQSWHTSHRARSIWVRERSYTQAPRGSNTLHYSVGRITLNTLWCRISVWRQQQQQHSTRTNSAGCKTNLLERLPRLNSIFSAKIENFSSPPPFVVILGSFVSEEPKFYHQNSMLKIIVRSFNSDLEGPTISPLPGRRCLLRRNSDLKHTDFSNNELLFFIDTISRVILNSE